MIASPNDSLPRNTEFDITTFTIAVEGLVYVSEGKNIRPYILLVAAYSVGLVTNKELGPLHYEGFTAGGGGGVRFPISEKVALSIEGIAIFGSAKWKHPPFKNSSSDKYNPSTIVALANFSFLVN
jgi:hypothetical protein